MPIDPEELQYVLNLHERSYRLLRWIDSSLKRGTLHISFIRENLSSREAAKEWVRQFMAVFPADARPKNPDELEEFSNLFISYLGTFRLIDDPQPHTEPSDGPCQCDICRRLVEGNHFVPRRLKPSDHRVAGQLIRQLVRNVAAETGHQLTETMVEQVASNHQLADLLAMATYAHRLCERARIGEGDPADLILWRISAWTQSGSPKRGFKLDVEAIVNAECVVARLIDAVRSATNVRPHG